MAASKGKSVVTPILSDSEIIMKDTPNMRELSTREALSRKKQMNDRGITSAMADKQIDKKVIELCNAKAEITGQPASSYVSGYESYVSDLVEFAGMSKLERYQWGKTRAFPSVATPDEILDAL
jgi:hypothetical protein